MRTCERGYPGMNSRLAQQQEGREAAVTTSPVTTTPVASSPVTTTAVTSSPLPSWLRSCFGELPGRKPERETPHNLCNLWQSRVALGDILIIF